jgi:hypothetical protein
VSPVVGASQALADVHVWWAWVVIVANGVAGAWALGAHRWEALRHRALWWFTGAAQVSILVEVVLGTILIQGRDTEPFKFHMFYAFVALFSAAIIYSYRAQLRDHRHLLYGFGGLFLMGCAIRALEVGPH